MDKDQVISSLREELSKAREKIEELSCELKSKEREHSSQIIELQTQLQAEQSKNSSLQASIKNAPKQISELKSQLQMSQTRQKELSQILSERSDTETQKLKVQHEEYKQNYMQLVKEKEKKIYELEKTNSEQK